MDGPCLGELQIAATCVASNPVCEECFFLDGTFGESFPKDVETQFRSTLAFIPPSEYGFCNEANARICLNYDQAQSCCCKEETMAFINCQFNSLFKYKYGVTEANCEQNCDFQNNASGGPIIIIVIVACVLFILTGSGYCYWRRKRVEGNGKGGIPVVNPDGHSKGGRFSRKDKETESQKTTKVDDLHDEQELGGHRHGGAGIHPVANSAPHHRNSSRIRPDGSISTDKISRGTRSRRNSKEFQTRSRSNSKEPIRSRSTSSREKPRSRSNSKEAIRSGSTSSREKPRSRSNSRDSGENTSPASIPNYESDPSSSSEESSDDDDDNNYSTPSIQIHSQRNQSKSKQKQEKQSSGATSMGRIAENRDSNSVSARSAGVSGGAEEIKRGHLVEMEERQVMTLWVENNKASTRKSKEISQHERLTELAVAEARMRETNLKLLQHAHKSDINKDLVAHELHALAREKRAMAEEIERLRQEKAKMTEALFSARQQTEMMRSNFEKSVSSGASPPPIGVVISVSDIMSVDGSTISDSCAPDEHHHSPPPPPSRRLASHFEKVDSLQSSKHKKERHGSSRGSETRSSKKSSSKKAGGRDRAAIDPYSEGGQQSNTSDKQRSRSTERFPSKIQERIVHTHHHQRGPITTITPGSDRRNDRSTSNSERLLSRNSDHGGQHKYDKQERSRSNDRFPPSRRIPERTMSRTKSERFYSRPMPNHEQKLPPERTKSDQLGGRSERSTRIPERGLTRAKSERIHSQPIEKFKCSERRVPERGILSTMSGRRVAVCCSKEERETTPHLKSVKISERRVPERSILKTSSEGALMRVEREIPDVRSIKRAKSGEKLRKAERY